MQHIHCTVSNCHYWDTGNVCLAKEILVTLDSVANQAPDNLDANKMMEVAQQFGSAPAQTCMTTCCKTFVEKNSPGITVQRMSRSEYEQTKQMKP